MPSPPAATVPPDAITPPSTSRPPRLWQRLASAAVVWALGALATASLKGQVDLGSQAMPLVLAAAASAFWLPTPAVALLCVLATLGFNWRYVPPQSSLNVAAPGHLLLLGSMLVVSSGAALLVGRQRRLGEERALQAERLLALQALGERLRSCIQAEDFCRALEQALGALELGEVASLWSRGQPSATHASGLLSADERSGLFLCMRLDQAFGPGTGRYEHQGDWYLPVPGSDDAHGALLIRLRPDALTDEATRRHAQALCSLAGQALDRHQALQREAQAHERAQAQQLRNTLLAAISHDYRTPLAAIMSAASSLREQDERLSTSQRRRLLDGVLDELDQLTRLTDNALQLARLDAPGMRLQADWQSPEEIVGAIAQRLRARGLGARLRTRLEAGLPLLRCDAVLIVQLLDNLIDNALKYSPPEQAVELLLRQLPGELLIAVRDRGPGVPAAQRERIFELFERGPQPASAADGAADAPPRRGAGVGLALCRAIAQAHGGRLTLRARSHGGSAFELRLPLPAAPQSPAEGATALPPENGAIA